MTVQIRKAMSEDNGRLEKLLRDALPGDNPRYHPAELAALVADRAFVSPLSRHEFLVADQGGRLVGAVAFGRDVLGGSRTWSLGFLCVHPDCRGRGIAGRLVSDVVRRITLAQPGGAFIRACCRRSGVDRLFGRAGFSTNGAVQVGEDIIIEMGMRTDAEATIEGEAA